MDLHHMHGLHDAQNLLRDAGAFLQDLPDELGRVPLTDLVKELHHHPRKPPSCRRTWSPTGSCPQVKRITT